MFLYFCHVKCQKVQLCNALQKGSGASSGRGSAQIQLKAQAVAVAVAVATCYLLLLLLYFLLLLLCVHAVLHSLPLCSFSSCSLRSLFASLSLSLSLLIVSGYYHIAITIYHCCCCSI